LLSLFLFWRQFARRSVRIKGPAIDYFECWLFFSHGVFDAGTRWFFNSQRAI